MNLILPSLSPTERAVAKARLTENVDRSGGPSACHPWTGGSLVRGYGVFHVRLGPGKRRLVKAHRLAFEVAIGEAPPLLDHTCHTDECVGLGERCPHRLCCNATHLEAATHSENAKRSRALTATCRNGHRRTPENTYETPDGQRHCRACAAARAREDRDRVRGQRKPQARGYRPRGMSVEQAVRWALADQPDEGCASWPGITPDGEGYVSVVFGGKHKQAHRLVFEVMIGPIPEGHVIDHTCHGPGCEGGRRCPHRACIRPEHLAAVSAAENVAPNRTSRRRPEECVHGHDLSDAYVARNGSRHCRECGRVRLRASRAKARKSAAVD